MGLTILTLIARTDVSQIRWRIGILGGYMNLQTFTYGRKVDLSIV